jgi:hypothetical protein
MIGFYVFLGYLYLITGILSVLGTRETPCSDSRLYLFLITGISSVLHTKQTLCSDKELHCLRQFCQSQFINIELLLSVPLQPDHN